MARKSNGLWICVLLLISAAGNVMALDTQSGCPLSPRARTEVVNVISEYFYGGSFVAEETHVNPDPDPLKSLVRMGFQSQLVGIGGQAGSLRLVDACRSAVDFEPYCDDSGVPGAHLNFCIRLSCEAKGIYNTFVYWTIPPETSPLKKSALSYSLKQPHRVVTYDPNPGILWRVDSTLAGYEFVTGAVQNHVTLSFGDGNTLRLSHSGIISAVKQNRNDHISSFALHLVFPAIVRGQDALIADIRADETGGQGSIMMGGRRLASMELHPEDTPDILQFVWEEGCK